MESKQKYTGVNSRVRKVILSADFFEKLEKEDDVISEQIMTSLKQMKNEIQGHTSLAITFNDDRDKPRFVAFNFIELNREEVKLTEYEDISTDQYLDMLLDGELLQTTYTITNI
tara:strand:+ start:1108 stop:1449 length:342 start_codon:yes stop_codon:yes gene_type:complete